MRELDPSLYTIAWIAPLAIEAQAAMHMLDARHDGGFPHARGDDYVFKAGEMCGHNIIIAKLPPGREYGTGAAAALSSQIKKFFPNLWFALLVGVAAGLPSHPNRDIRLGDIIIAMPEGDTAALVAYDLGKETGSGFHLLKNGHAMVPTESIVQSAIGEISDEYPYEARTFLPHYEKMKNKVHRGGTFADPGQEQDVLYATTDDEQGDKSVVVLRARRAEGERTCVWYGPIGSGEKLVKKGRIRDGLRDTYNLIGLEMEAAGIMNRIAVGVIRGVCDYGDERKNKQWQPYAAAMAAAYAKAVLERIRPEKKTKIQKVGEETEGNASAKNGGGKGDGLVTMNIHSTGEKFTNGLHVSSHRTHGGTMLSHRPFAREILRGPLCYRCDHRSHFLTNCIAFEETVLEGRETRIDDGRCWNCGDSRHWRPNCPWEDLLERKGGYYRYW